MKFTILSLFFYFLSLPNLLGQEKTIRFEGSFSGSAVITDGSIESTLFLRAAKPAIQNYLIEMTTGVDHRRKTATFLYSLAVRKDWPQPHWAPFLLAGIGGETVIVGPYLETRPIFLAGAGSMFPIQESALIRIEYQFQRIYAPAYHFNRHYFLLGFLLRWTR